MADNPELPVTNGAGPDGPGGGDHSPHAHPPHAHPPHAHPPHDGPPHDHSPHDGPPHDGPPHDHSPHAHSPHRPAGRAPRHDGWTLERQHDFLDDLGCHGNVTRAAGAVGLSPSSAYRLRGREAAGGREGAFAAGWRAATAMAYQRLRDVALERIENGTVQTVFYKGAFAGTRLVFSDRLLLGMLNHLKPADDAADPADAYAAALDAFAVAVETGTDPVMPAVMAAAPAAPVAGDEPSAGAGDEPLWPSPGEGPYHDARAAAARGRLARGADPFVPRFPGRIYPPHPDDCWVDAYPDGLSADDLADEDPYELALVGLNRDGTPCAAATRAAALTRDAALTRAAASRAAPSRA